MHNNPLVALYETHVLGDGHGRLTTEATKVEEPAEVPRGSVVQRKKYAERLRAQRAEIALAIQRFRALDGED